MSGDSTLIKYGKSFQWKVVAGLITDGHFLKKMRGILKPEYFDSEASRELVRMTFDYFDAYKVTPTLAVFKVEIEKAGHDDIFKGEIVDELRQVNGYANATDLPHAKDEMLEFCRNQELKSALLESVDLLEAGKYDAIRTMIDRALKAGMSFDLGHNYLQDVEARYNEAVRNVIATPWAVVNEVMAGGLGRGETGVMMAPPGLGKTWLLCAIGACALRQGKNVIHYTMELSEAYVGLRYDALMTGYNVNDLKYHKDNVTETLRKYDGGGQLIIKYYPSGKPTTLTFEAHLEECVLEGIRPELIITDYADLMRPVVAGEKDYKSLQNIYVDLNGLAGTYNCPLWTASQSGRESINKDIIEAGDTAGSLGKIMEAFFVMSLSRKIEDKILHTARAHIVKNRFGPDGLTFGCKFNASNGSIQMFDDTTLDGKKLKTDMQGDRNLKNVLADRYKNLTPLQEAIDKPVDVPVDPKGNPLFEEIAIEEEAPSDGIGLDEI